jgi:disulfide bond formation protein DsbB
MLTDAKFRHNMHHTMQLIYEIILLIIACIEAKNIEIASIVLGLLGSICGLLHIYRLDMLLNSGAFILRFQHIK